MDRSPGLKRLSPKRTHDFRSSTLVELLGACAVFAVMIVLVVALMTSTTTTSRRVGDHLVASSDALTLLDMIEADIKSVQPTRGPSEWMSIVKGGANIGAAGILTNSAIYLITRSTEASYGSDGVMLTSDLGLPRAVRYQVEFKPLLPNESRRAGLFRSTAGESGQSKGEVAISQYVGLTNLIDSWAAVQTSSSDLLSDVVLGFQAEIIWTGSDGKPMRSNARSARFMGDNVLLDGAASPGVPVGLEVSLEILPSKLMNRLGEASPEEFDRQRKREGRFYTRFIPFSSSPRP